MIRFLQPKSLADVGDPVLAMGAAEFLQVAAHVLCGLARTQDYPLRTRYLPAAQHSLCVCTAPGRRCAAVALMRSVLRVIALLPCSYRCCLAWQALPRSVIRSGNVIEIRSGVADLLSVGSAPDERPDVVVVDTPGTAWACYGRIGDRALAGFMIVRAHLQEEGLARRSRALVPG